MSNGDDSVLASLYRLETKVRELVCKGEGAEGERRDPKAFLDYLQRILVIEGLDGFMDALRQPRTGSLINTFPQELWVPSWEKYYRDEHGVKVNLGSVLEAHPVVDHPEFSWPVFPVPEVGLNRAFAKCRDHYPCYSAYGDDLERAMKWHQRTTANGSYMVRFRPRPEADEENKNLSAAVQLEKSEAKCVTIHEQILLKDFIWCFTGGFHLDVVKMTLCAGSRAQHGAVPSAYWDLGQFYLNRYHPSDAGEYFRARSAV